MLHAFYNLLSCIIFLAVLVVLLDCVTLTWVSVGVLKNVIQSNLSV